MLPKIKNLFFFLAILFVTGSAFAALPGEGTLGGGEKFHRPNPLNLTAEQQEKFKELKDNFKKDTVFLRNDIRIKRLELKTLWTVPKPEKEKILAKQKELRELVSQLQTKIVDVRLAFRDMLTPEQAAQAALWGPGMGHKGRMHRYLRRAF